MRFLLQACLTMEELEIAKYATKQRLSSC